MVCPVFYCGVRGSHIRVPPTTSCSFRAPKLCTPRSQTSAVAVRKIAPYAQKTKMAASTPEEPTIYLALPKGHMQENVNKLLEDAGIKVTLGNARGYRPTVPLSNYDVKLLKPQNILGMLQAGTRDLGFAGADWMEELGISGLVQVLDTGLDPVRIVAASPDAKILDKLGYHGRKLIVASEYEVLTKQWLAKKGIDAQFLRAYGATESLPPEDADIIVDNAATGSTLKANSLEIIDSLMSSTTRLFASAAAWADPAKRARIQKFASLLQAVLDARKRLMVTFNLPADKLEAVLDLLPAARAPTVSPLHHGQGYAVQIAAETGKVPELLPFIKEHGGTDVVVTSIKMLMA